MLIGIDGRGGSGKSTLAQALAARFPAAHVVEFDDFYLPSAERRARRDRDDGEIGGDFDWRRLRDQVLRPLSVGEPARYQRYDWREDRLAEWHEVPADAIVIVEGNYSTRAAIREYYDFTIWVDAPHDVRLARGVERDGEDARERWLTEWMPEEDRYIAAEHPEQHARARVDGSVRSGS